MTVYHCDIFQILLRFYFLRDYFAQRCENRCRRVRHLTRFDNLRSLYLLSLSDENIVGKIKPNEPIVILVKVCIHRKNFFIKQSLQVVAYFKANTFAVGLWVIFHKFFLDHSLKVI